MKASPTLDTLRLRSAAITSPARSNNACQRRDCFRSAGKRIYHTPDSSTAIGVTAGFETMNNQKIIIGQYDAWGTTRIFGISPNDQRQHLYVIGKTGVGKTTLLRNLILQHIQCSFQRQTWVQRRLQHLNARGRGRSFCLTHFVF